MAHKLQEPSESEEDVDDTPKNKKKDYDATGWAIGVRMLAGMARETNCDRTRD